MSEPPPAQASSSTDRANNRRRTNNNRRAAKFNAGLTAAEAPAETANSNGAKPKPKKNTNKNKGVRLPQGDDLASSLIRSLSVAPYIECLICFGPIHPAQPTWSCSPLIPIVPSDPGAEPQYCWSTLHLKCARSWSEKSYKEMKEAWRARGEPDKGGSWRCPGCQGRREQLIGGYTCFCGSTKLNATQTRFGSIPHSCGNSCSRPRSSCNDPCPLSCHPGPCPDCKVTLELRCPCPRASPVTVKCEERDSVSCGSICGRPLSCGDSNHQCKSTCHLGDCDPCEEIEKRRCWCGKIEREGLCGSPEVAGPGGDYPRGFSCGQPSDRPFDCGIHKSQELCDYVATTTPEICPFSPTKITTCPCSKTLLSETRTDCTDPIPCCKSNCDKVLKCGHSCQSQCHLSDCPPCAEMVNIPCRCGLTVQKVRCGNLGDKEILCDKPCGALRLCRRHRCDRVCCLLASFVVKGKKRAGVRPDEHFGAPDLAADLHVCDLVCGKLLACKNHNCEERDHVGPCPPCFRSSFDEMVCTCGRTILEPPIPCGTVLNCAYPCAAPAPDCGHPAVPHSCHSPSVPCPPCPHLTTKSCSCGKTEVKNVRCSLEQDKIGCGKVCGRVLSCGFHTCEKLCPSTDCPPVCTQPCGKSRKDCGHGCRQPCHAPAVCPDEPCTFPVSVHCDCGRITQTASCHKSKVSPPKCTRECGLVKRNQRLAEALGIDPQRSNSAVVEFSDDLVTFARRNIKFISVVESNLAAFVTSSKKNQVLPHMPLDRRNFVVGLASVYRIDTQLVDQEPHRSVQLIRRIDTRVPPKLLSAHVASSLGRLNDYRS